MTWYHVNEKLPKANIYPYAAQGNYNFLISKTYPVKIYHPEREITMPSWYQGYLCRSIERIDDYWRVIGCQGFEVLYWYDLPSLRVKLK